MLFTDSYYDYRYYYDYYTPSTKRLDEWHCPVKRQLVWAGGYKINFKVTVTFINNKEKKLRDTYLYASDLSYLNCATILVCNRFSRSRALLCTFII